MRTRSPAPEMASEDAGPTRAEVAHRLNLVFRSLSGDLGQSVARGCRVAFQIECGGPWIYCNPPAATANIGGQSTPLTPVHREPVEGPAEAAPVEITPPTVSSDSSNMGVKEDDGIPWVKFPPKPEGWKGDPGNPNFKTLGTLSPPVMRKIEPAGPYFLAFARRVSPSTRYFFRLLTIV
jgi:hypothetical protein